MPHSLKTCRQDVLQEAAAGDFSMTLYRQPMKLDVPIDADALERIYDVCWRRDLWDQQPPGHKTGFDSPSPHGDTQVETVGAVAAAQRRIRRAVEQHGYCPE